MEKIVHGVVFLWEDEAFVVVGGYEWVEFKQAVSEDYRETGRGASTICHGLVPQLSPLTAFSLD